MLSLPCIELCYGLLLGDGLATCDACIFGMLPKYQTEAPLQHNIQLTVKITRTLQCMCSVYNLSTLCPLSLQSLSTTCLPSVQPLCNLCLPPVYPLSTLCLPAG